MLLVTNNPKSAVQNMTSETNIDVAIGDVVSLARWDDEYGSNLVSHQASVSAIDGNQLRLSNLHALAEDDMFWVTSSERIVATAGVIRAIS